MRSFENYNPVVVSIYFLMVISIVMVSMNPILVLTSCVGAGVYFLQKERSKQGDSLWMYLVLFFVMALINPLCSHNGMTVLFVLNNTPITWEATVYGAAAAGMVLAVLLWFRLFSQLMSSDKLLYLFGKLSPKIALVLSMGLRYVELFRRQARKIEQSQTAMGLYKEDNIVDTVKGKLHIFSILLTWALEHGIITADSMAARGYGTGKRSRLENFRFRRSDILFLICTLVLGLITGGIIGIGAMSFVYYPAIQYEKITGVSLIGYLSYGMLVLIPEFVELEERMKWKYLQSKI